MGRTLKIDNLVNVVYTMSMDKNDNEKKQKDRDRWLNICLKERRDADIITWRETLGNNFSATMRQLIRRSQPRGLIKTLRQLETDGLIKLVASELEIEQALVL